MSEVIRRAIVEMEIRQKRGGGASDAGIKRGFEEQTKASKEIERQHDRNNRAARESARAHEEFGQKSVRALAQAGQGALQFTRGLALMATSGQEDTQKLLENLIKIEAAVAILGGAGRAAKAMPEIRTGILAATVAFDRFLVTATASQTVVAALGIVMAPIAAAGAAIAGSWALQNREIERQKKLLEGLRQEHNKASQAESALMAAQAANKVVGRSAMTDANLSPTERMAAQDRELKQIREERQYIRDETKASDEAARQLRQKAGRNRSERETLPDSLFRGLMMGWSSAGAIGEATAKRDRLLKDATEMEGTANQFTGRASMSAQHGFALAQREKQILDERSSYRISQVRSRENQQIEGMRHADQTLDPMEQWQRNNEKYMFEMQKKRQQPFVDAFAPGMSQIHKSMSMQDLREGGIHMQANEDAQRIQQEGTEAVQAMIGVLNYMKEEATRFRAEVTAGQTE